jgi:hypothetical protein
MKHQKRMNRYEKREMQKLKVAQAHAGTGLFIFENNSDGDLTLPKPAADGRRVIGPRGQFQGDSYFHSLVKPPMRMLKFVKQIIPQEVKQKQITETTQMSEKLILDQPDQVTTAGKVEHVVTDPNAPQPLNDNSIPQQPKPEGEVLLNEDPLSGVEIIMG